MMRKILKGLLIVVVLFFASACSKKSETKYEKEMKVFFPDEDKQHVIYKKTEVADENKIGSIKGADGVFTKRTVSITKKEKISNFIEIQCPESIKAKCDDGMGYINFNEFSIETISGSEDFSRNLGNSENSHILLREEPQAMKGLPRLRDWQKARAKTDKLALYPEDVVHYVLSQKNDDQRILAANELIKLLEVYQLSRNNTDSKKEELEIPEVKKLIETNKILEISDATKASIILPPDFTEGKLEKLTGTLLEYKKSLITDFNIGFPMRPAQWKDLAAMFNGFATDLSLQKGLFHKMIENEVIAITFDGKTYLAKSAKTVKDSLSGYKAASAHPSLGTAMLTSPAAAAFAYEDKIINGVFDVSEINLLPVNPETGTVPENKGEYTYKILAITSAPDKTGLGFSFKLTTDKGVMTVVPVSADNYLSRSGPNMKKILESVPKNYKEILEAYDFEEAVMYIAMLKGVPAGEFPNPTPPVFDRNTGYMTYNITSDKNNYWMLFEIFRKRPDLNLENEYKGTVNYNEPYCADESCSEQIKEIQWIQPKGELKIKLKLDQYSYEGNSTTHVDEESSCLSENYGELGQLYIRFKPEDLAPGKRERSLEIIPFEQYLNPRKPCHHLVYPGDLLRYQETRDNPLRIP